MKYCTKLMVLSLWLTLIVTVTGWSQILLSGYFIATDNCPALQSIKI